MFFPFAWVILLYTLSSLAQGLSRLLRLLFLFRLLTDYFGVQPMCWSLGIINPIENTTLELSVRSNGLPLHNPSKFISLSSSYGRMLGLRLLLS